MSRDTLTYLSLTGFIALYLVACLRGGAVPTRGGLVRRSENPGMYWVGITMAGSILVVLVLFGATWVLTH
jgi:hypothetical protein